MVYWPSLVVSTQRQGSSWLKMYVHIYGEVVTVASSLILTLSQIYQSSVAHGASAVQTAGGLYHMGNVFMKEGKPIIALSFMDQVLL